MVYMYINKFIFVLNAKFYVIYPNETNNWE